MRTIRLIALQSARSLPRPQQNAAAVQYEVQGIVKKIADCLAMCGVERPVCLPNEVDEFGLEQPSKTNK